MSRPLACALLLALVLPAAFAAHAPHGRCDSAGQPALGIVEITGGTARTTFYVDDRNYVTGNGVYVYEETGSWTPRGPGIYNDDVTRHNLQRGGASAYVPDDPEICVDDPETIPDHLIF